MVKHGTMTTSPPSGTDRTHALSTGLSGEDAGEDVGHDDERLMDVSAGEGWGVNRSNGRSYILGPAVNQDPSGNIDKDQIRG